MKCSTFSKWCFLHNATRCGTDFKFNIHIWDHCIFLYITVFFSADFSLDSAKKEVWPCLAEKTEAIHSIVNHVITVNLQGDKSLILLFQVVQMPNVMYSFNICKSLGSPCIFNIIIYSTPLCQLRHHKIFKYYIFNKYNILSYNILLDKRFIDINTQNLCIQSILQSDPTVALVSR